MKRFVDFKIDDKKKKFDFDVSWKDVAIVFIWVLFLILIIFIGLYIKYRFDLNSYFINSF